jgi:hypothetical protein
LSMIRGGRIAVAYQRLFGRAAGEKKLPSGIDSSGDLGKSCVRRDDGTGRLEAHDHRYFPTSN